jgi:hypothetical protein
VSGVFILHDCGCIDVLSVILGIVESFIGFFQGFGEFFMVGHEVMIVTARET